MPKKCIICGNPHSNTMYKTCSTSCQKQHERNLKDKLKQKKQDDKVKQALKKAKQVEKKKNSIPVLKKRLWKIISEYIRRKYADKDGMVKCVTCREVKHWKEMQAGHYIPAGSSNYLRYVESNIHPQDYACNVGRHGNLIEYRIFMVKTYGEKYVEMLTGQRNELLKYTNEYLLQKIEEYQEKLALLDK